MLRPGLRGAKEGLQPMSDHGQFVMEYQLQPGGLEERTILNIKYRCPLNMYLMDINTVTQPIFNGHHCNTADI